MLYLEFKGSWCCSYSDTTVAAWPWSLQKLRVWAMWTLACVCGSVASLRSYPGACVAVTDENATTGATPQASVGGVTPLYSSASFISSASTSPPRSCCCHSNPTHHPLPILPRSMLGNMTSPGTFLLWDFFVLVLFSHLIFWFSVLDCVHM